MSIADGIKTLGAAAAVCAFAAFTGCETVSDARRLQEEYATATNDVRAAKARSCADLSGGGLVDYVAFALTNRPAVMDARLAVERARLALELVDSERAAKVNLRGGFSQSTANRTSHFSWHQEPGKATAGVEFDLLLVDFGRISAQEREACENLAGALLDLSETEFTVFEEVSRGYFTVLRNKALLEVAYTNEHTYAEHLRNAESRFGAGEARKLDVLKARVDLSGARLQTISASNDVVGAEAQLLLALGLEGDLTDRERVIPGADRITMTKTALPPTVYTAADALELARTNSPAVKAARARLRAAYGTVDYAVADLLPKITLSSAFSFADPAWNWSWGFSAIQTLLDGWRKENAIRRAMVDLKSARNAVEQREQKLAHDLEVAASTRDNARESLAAAAVEAAQARENLQTVQEQYRVGEASRLDFTDAAGSLTSALGAQVKAFYAAEIAEANLIKLTGAGYPGIKMTDEKKPFEKEDNEEGGTTEEGERE